MAWWLHFALAMNTRHSSAFALALSLIGLPTAFAADTTSAAEPVGPVAGSQELRIGQGFVPGIAVTGLNVYAPSGDGGSNDHLTLLGAGVGYGKFLTDNLELGANVNVLFGRAGDNNLFGPGIAPFVRLMSSPARLRYFGEASLTYNAFFSGGDTGHLFGGGLDVGLEYAVTPSWSVRVSPNYRYLRAASGDEIADGALHTFGVSWGISAYF